MVSWCDQRLMLLRQRMTLLQDVAHTKHACIRQSFAEMLALERGRSPSERAALVSSRGIGASRRR